ncbi:MAG: FliH/SctL family protein [Candidatus Sericytochromatia bacterium]
MGLLKAADVEYLTLEEDEEYLLEEGEEGVYNESESYYRAGRQVDFAAPVIIGGEGIDFDFDSLDLLADNMAGVVFFTNADTDVTFGEPITVGGTASLTHLDETSYDTGYQEDLYEETYEETPLEEGFFDDMHQEEGSEEEPAYLKDFAAMSTPDDESGQEAASAWASQKRNTMLTRLDDKVKLMMDEQKSAFREQSKEQLAFVSAEEKQRLVSEALDSLRNAPQAAELDFEKIFQDIADYIENLAWHHTEKLQQDLEDERAQMLANVEEYVENSIHEQRESMMLEAEEYISSTVQEYKKSLNEDNEFIKAANQIIAQRESILNEAYDKSLMMIQEAEAEHARIVQDAYGQQEQGQQMLQEAEAQVELMAQEAQAEAERIISEANMESARIIEAAEQSHQEIVEAATQDGFNVGYQEGREEAIKENAQLLMETTNALNKLHAAFPVAVKQNEDKLIKLALEISREVIQDELAMKPEIVLKSVERAIGKVSDLEKVIIKVNPLDLDLVLPKQEFFRKLLPDVQDFIITGHYSIERGGCHIETNSGTIDAQVNTQLAVVEEVFQQIRSEYDFDDDGEMEEDEI